MDFRSSSWSLVLVALLGGGAVARAEDSSPAAAPDEPVRAFRYRVYVTESALELSHGAGDWVDEIWLPDAKVAANVVNEWRFDAAGKFQDQPAVNAFFSEKMRNWSSTSGLSDPVEQPVLETQVHKALADRIVALAEATRRRQDERRALGSAVLAAGTLALLDQTPGVYLGPPSDEAKRWLDGWAEPVGEEISVEKFPRRVKRSKDGAEMVLVPRGSFSMGHEAIVEEEPGRSYRGMGPSRPVELTKSCYMDVAEVTVGAWKRFARETGAGVPAAVAGDDDRLPARGITHGEAEAYARWAGSALPTEAQWERAARAGRAYALYPTDDYHDVPAQRNGADDDDRFDGPAPVGSFPANAWGLFDLAGNVAEWCADGYAPFTETRDPTRDPVGAVKAADRVVKGGSWKARGTDLSIGHREPVARDLRREDLGFRCARSLP